MKHPEYRLYEWDNVVRCNISTTGAWKLTHASYGLYTERNWSAVWNAGFTDVARHQHGAIYVSAMERSHIALTLAQLIMESSPWSEANFSYRAHAGSSHHEYGEVSLVRSKVRLGAVAQAQTCIQAIQ
jgi:hypothetical protein